ncbi:hypothetical protein [Roseovarius sp. MBR-6]|jgi:hypothetical protein|uniref:phage head spike fiber domain-containing protein n=1 Tax=Roseovarius sp. MBR-6 TaxID=3156459 RepID=UPI00339947D8
MPQVTLLKAEAVPQIIADTLASDELSRRVLSSTALALVLASQPSEPSLVLDFARGGYGTGYRAGINAVETFTSSMTFTRASTATYWGADGLLKTAAIDAPRLDHDPVTGAARGLLIEGVSTNELARSADFADSVWSKTGSGTGLIPVVTADQGIAPDGTMTADRVQLALAGGVSTADRSQLSQTASPATGDTTYTASVWVKSFDGGTYAVSLTINGVGAAVTGIGPDWTRVWTSLLVPDGTAPQMRLTLRGNLGVSDSADLLVWGAQLEKGAVATSYIPTGASPVTRAADIARANNTSWLNPAGGTILIEAETPVISALTAFFELHDGGTTNRVLMRSGGVATAQVFAGGTTSASLAVPSATPNVVTRRAIAWAENDFAATADGGTALTDSVGALPTGMNQLWIGMRNDVGQYPLGGHIRRLIHYPARLTNAQLQEITA